jgi:hypothetical protein
MNTENAGGYKVIVEASMKQTIQDWIANAGQENINNMTLVFVAHGHPTGVFSPSRDNSAWVDPPLSLQNCLPKSF